MSTATQRTRVLLFSTLYPSSTRPLRGVFVETRLRELLTRHDFDVRVVAPVPWYWSRNPEHGPHAVAAATPARERRHGIEVHHPQYLVVPKIGMNLAPFWLALGAWRCMTRLKREGFDFDLIDAHYYYPDGVAAALLARWFERPLTITARGSDINQIGEFAWPRRLMRWAAGVAAASIGVSQALCDRMRDIGLPATRLLAMRNGVDLERFSPQPREAARRDLGLHGGPILLCVGHLHEHKGQRLAVEAAAALRPRHPELSLLIVGEGEDKPALQALAQRLGIADRVRFAGPVENDRLSPWYSAADALILASSREGWPNVVLEAMACGTPVVASRVGGIPEIFGTSPVGRLLPQRDAAALAQVLTDLLHEPPSREAVRAHAAAFGWARTSDQQAELFHRLAPVR